MTASGAAKPPVMTQPSSTQNRVCRVDRLPQSGPLYYVCEQGTGITRERTAEGFVYRGPSGRTVRDKATLERIRRLAVPPAWQDVWICADAHGHLQATGRDSKGRKQYKYHEAWRELRDAGKFERMTAFGRALPGIRRQAETDLSRTDLSKATVLGLVVLLLDETLLRVGNEEYAREHDAYGLTTLRDRHACVCGPEVRLVFRGKGGKTQAASINDRRLAQTVKRTQELPGDVLFQYLNADGEPRADHVGRCERLPARHHRTGVQREGLQDLGRHAGRDPRVGGLGAHAARQARAGEPGEQGPRLRGRPSRQHPGRRPALLRAPRRHRLVPRRHPV